MRESPEEQSCPPGLYTKGLLAVVQRCKAQLLSDFTLPSVSFCILQEKVHPSSITSYSCTQGCGVCSGVVNAAIFVVCVWPVHFFCSVFCQSCM